MHLRHLFSSRLRGSLLLGSLLVASSFSTQAAEEMLRKAVGKGAYEMAYSQQENALWLATSQSRKLDKGGVVYRLDPVTLEVTQAIHNDLKPFGATINNTTQTLWFGNTVNSAVTAIDAKTGEVKGRLVLDDRKRTEEVRPLQPRELVADDASNTVYISGIGKEIEIVAASDLNVLISGETGTGKELVAKAIHEASPRAVNPLVYLNCAALPESVAESELFGHVKGAFTGAISNRSGKFEMADNGTLFLDEIGELSLALQAKLLRVLQYGDIQRVGDDRSLRVDVRVLAATNRDLREEVLAGRFRADLFHRLSVFPLSVPPLRERGDDVILLAGYFCEQCRLRLGLSRVVLSAGARNLLQHYRFPGNVRELEHAIHRAVVLARATRSGDEVILEAQHFAFPEVTLPPPEAAAVPVVKQNLREATEAFQRETIRQALAQNHHNWAACARMLETDVANLHRLAKRLGLKD